MFFNDIVDPDKLRLYSEASNLTSFNLTSGKPKYPIVVAVPEVDIGLKFTLF